MESKMIISSVIICAICAGICFAPIKFAYKKTLIAVLWSACFILVSICISLMLKYLITVDLRYLYVFGHVSADDLLIYKITAIYAGQEGLFLMWAFMMGIAGYFLLFIKEIDTNKAFGIFCVISFFIFLICFILSPFEKISVIPSSGLGADETFQNIWTIIHVPFIFAAYSVLAGLFSISALLAKSKNIQTINLIKLFIKISLFIIGAGIFTGIICSYHESGWEGYWAWDPMGNISLIVWLVLLGFLHRDEYNNLTVCILPFSLACFGAFLTKSGVLNKITEHSYTENNIIITQLLLFFIFGAVLFMDIQRRKMRKKTTDKSVRMNKENLFSNIILTYAGFLFFGTAAVIVSKTDTASVYYTSVSVLFVLIYSIILILEDKELIKNRGIIMVIISLAVVITIGFITDNFKLIWLLLLWITLMPAFLWVVTGQYRYRWRYCVINLGLILIIAGVIISGTLGKEGFILANINYDITISGHQIKTEEIINANTIIISEPQKDTVLDCSEMISNSKDNILIPYTTKPFIILFWIGCIVVVTQPLIEIIYDIKMSRNIDAEKISAPEFID